LHFEDVKVLLDVLNKLVDKGNTILVIEHNMDVIKVADYIIDIGPEGGHGGGQVLVTGTPEELSKATNSHTARFLKKELSVVKGA
jgi:excinuclease ABC subunit A